MKETAQYHPPEKVARFRSLFTRPPSLSNRPGTCCPLAAVLPRVEPRVGRILQRDYDLRAGDRATLEPPALIERTTGGIRWVSEPGVRRVILAPSYFARPTTSSWAGPTGGSTVTRSSTTRWT